MKMFAVSLSIRRHLSCGVMRDIMILFHPNAAICVLFCCFLQLSCKLDREFRCVELAELMTQNVVTLAIRYASRSRRMALAQRLSEIALEKASEVQAEQLEEQEEESEYSSVRQHSG